MSNQDESLERQLMNVLHQARQTSDTTKSPQPDFYNAQVEHEPKSRQRALSNRQAGNVSTPNAIYVNDQIESIALDGQFTAPKQQLQEHKQSLSPWQGFLFNREVGRLRREEALKIAKAVFEHEFEAIVQKLTLALDIEKKKTFIEYMRRTASLQRDLQKLDTAACLSLQQSLMEINVQIYTISNRNEQVINELLTKGVITQQQADQERAKNQELCERNLSGALATLDHMWDNHKQLLEHTLRIFLNELTTRGKL